MTKKRLVSFLCLLLVLTIPMTSIASTMEHALTITPGEALIPYLQGAESLIEILELSFLSEAMEGSGAIVLSLEDKDVLRIALRPDSTGLFAQSDAVNDKAVFVTWEDAITFIEENTYPTWELLLMFDAAKTLLGAARRGTLETTVMGVAQKVLRNVEPVLQTIAKDEPLAELFADICQSKKIAETIGAISPPDIGDTRITVHITTADCMRFLEGETAKAIVAAALTEFVPPKNLDNQVDYLLMMAKKQIKSMQIDVKINAVTAEGQVVWMDAGSKIADQYGSYVEFSGDYDCATGIDGVNHKGRFDIGSGGYVYIPDIQMQFDLMNHADHAVDGVYYVVSGGTQVAFVFGQKEANYMLDAYVRDKVSVVSPLYDFETPVASLKLVSKPVITSALDAINQSTGKNSIQILRISEAEMAEFTEDAIVNAAHAAFVAMSYVPDDIIRLIVKQEMSR